MTKLKIVYKPTANLIPHARNSRTHSEQQIAQIAASIKEFGFRVPVIVDGDNGIIAGHGRVQAALKLGLDEVPTVDGSDMTEVQRRMYVIADNKIALNASWDEEMLMLEIDDLRSMGADVELLAFTPAELKAFESEEEAENPYTDKIATPNYEPTGEKPRIEDLLDRTKTMELITKIEQSNVTEMEKQFLTFAASRHIVFDYSNIANFYAHSSKECQELMEESALVIIDFNKAIENGFVKVTKEIVELLHPEDEE